MVHGLALAQQQRRLCLCSGDFPSYPRKHRDEEMVSWADCERGIKSKTFAVTKTQCRSEIPAAAELTCGHERAERTSLVKLDFEANRGQNLGCELPGLPTEQYCDVTQQNKSDVRMNGELLRKPPGSLTKEVHFTYILLPLNEIKSPTSHRYQTHSSRYTIFPNSRSPEDCDTSIDASSHQHLHPNIPTKANDMNNMVQNTERALGITAYSQDFTGRAPMNPLILDNYHVKAVGKLTGELGEDVELKEIFLPSLPQVGPLEGCTVYLLQGQCPNESILQEQCSDASVFIQGFYCHSRLLRHDAE
ncbi:uncharacterized protein C7orf31 homolog [Pezoporus wallicus]|uniref:uncharacterized protein C7orf31 homolog n=1 Tax=Pezoporus wallicus TaxID=35540 RepID=UPI002550E221|nr:uncharacterized protein C7orf31 homolog [Pezoporus wallicus]